MSQKPRPFLYSQPEERNQRGMPFQPFAFATTKASSVTNRTEPVAERASSHSRRDLLSLLMPKVYTKNGAKQVVSLKKTDKSCQLARIIRFLTHFVNQNVHLSQNATKTGTVAGKVKFTRILRQGVSKRHSWSRKLIFATQRYHFASKTLKCRKISLKCKFYATVGVFMSFCVTFCAFLRHFPIIPVD